MSSILSEYRQAAKIRGLNAKESNFIYEYAQKLHLDPNRTLVNKQFFDAIVKEYKKNNPKPDEIFINTIKEKLNFIPALARRLYSSKEIPKNQKAKFYFSSTEYVPITLSTQYDNYALWKVELHGKMDMLKPKMQGFVIFEEKHLIAYKFDAVIEDVLIFHNEKFLKIPHSDNLKVLAKRRYPRIDVNIPGVVKRKGKLRDNPYYKCTICNLSEGGAKICVGEDLFHPGEELELKFKLNMEDMEVQSKVIAKIAYEAPGQYGVQFLHMDPHMRFILNKYINMYLKESPI